MLLGETQAQTMTSAAPPIRPITDEATRATLRARVSDLVSADRDLRLTITRHAELVAVPVRGSYHFNLEDVERIGRAFAALGSPDAYAVALEHWLRIEPAYAVDASVEGVSAFEKTCSHFNYALCSHDVRSIVACSTNDFFIVIGAPAFVQAAVGSTIDQAFDAFAEYAAEPPPAASSFMTRVHHALAVVLPGLEPGERIVVPDGVSSP